MAKWGRCIVTGFDALLSGLNVLMALGWASYIAAFEKPCCIHCMLMLWLRCVDGAIYGLCSEALSDAYWVGCCNVVAHFTYRLLPCLLVLHWLLPRSMSALASALYNRPCDISQAKLSKSKSLARTTAARSPRHCGRGVDM